MSKSPRTKKNSSSPEASDYFRVKKTIYFCYGHRLRDYHGPCKRLHGHNARVDIVCTTKQLDRRGMVVDFMDISRMIKKWIDANLDHTLLLRKDDPLIPLLRKAGEPFLSTDQNPTAEHIAQMIFHAARAQKLPVVSVTLWETEHASATYARNQA